MAIRKFVAPTTREAMMQVRRELGDDAVIIANRRVGNRIEILAAAPDAVEELVERSEQRSEPRIGAGRESPRPAERGAGRIEARSKAEPFQDFVRRQMQAEGEAVQSRAAPREMPARDAAREISARAAPAARKPGGDAALAMYQDVAEIEDDVELAPAPRIEHPATRRAEGSVTPRRSIEADTAGQPADEGAPRASTRATTLPQSHRAPQIENVPQAAEPAVFRRRPAYVAPTPRIETALAPRAQGAAAAIPTIDIVLEPQVSSAETGASALPPTSERAVTPVQAAPIASGHAVVPPLPMRSQAGPIATAARLREASLNAAAQAEGARQTAGGAKQPASAVPVPAQQPAKPVAPLAGIGPVALVAPTAQIAPATVSPSTAVVSPDAPIAPIEPTAPVGQTASSEHAAPVVQTAPITPLALAIETPSLAAIDASWDDLQFTTQATEPSVKHASAPQAPRPAEAEATRAVPAQSAAMQPAAVQPVAPPPVVVAQPAAEPAQPRLERQLLAELQSMRDILREQMATLANKPAPVAVRPGGPATRVMTRLLTAGFSADVARRIAANVPNNVDAAQAESWLHEVIAHNIRCAEAADGIVERAGRPGTPGQIFALVGPTGVGKTTTVAKLAARFAVRHGTSALGLITLDAYRVAAPEQLRTYGRILGTPVHLAQDSATLRELLATMTHKRLVLIDTCGLSQRDERLGEMLDLLGSAGTAGRPIQRVLLLNSASHAETLDEAARAWRANECTGAILTKLDEAARIGGSLDASLRHRLTLLGLTNGQRVPEDWHAANGRLLAHLALKPAAQLFELADEEGAALAQAQASALTAHG
jgi:flagellar biosynthesis protein FlhF